MILARLSRAVREQNWFAVVLEFVIVVAGVLLAFQISAWSNKSDQRAYARDVLTRLGSELDAISAVRQPSVAHRSQVAERLAEARLIIMGVTATSDLTPEQCHAVASSYFVGRAPDSVPALDELLESGAVESIDSPDLRRAAMELYAKREAVRSSADEGASRSVNLALVYPQAVRRVLTESQDDDDGWTLTADCDLDVMRASPAFQAAFLENFMWYRSNLEFVYLFFDEAIATLQSAIDAELGTAEIDEGA